MKVRGCPLTEKPRDRLTHSHKSNVKCKKTWISQKGGGSVKSQGQSESCVTGRISSVSYLLLTCSRVYIHISRSGPG